MNLHACSLKPLIGAFFFWGRLFHAEEPEGAGEDEEVPTAGGAGVPHESAGHSDATRGAGEELSGGCGGLQENHREASVAGLIPGRFPAPGADLLPRHHGLLRQPRRCSLDAATKKKITFLIEECHKCIVAGDWLQ